MPAIIVGIIKALLGVAFDQALNLAITLGVPWLVSTIYNHPKTPRWVKWLMDRFNVTQLLIDLVEELKKIKQSSMPTDMKKVAKVEAKLGVRRKAREMGGRVGHASETKGLD